MFGMNYDARTRAIFDFLYRDPDGVLRRYRVPEHMGDDQLRAEVNDLVEDINRSIPSGYRDGDFRALMPKIHAELRRRHGAQIWPSSRLFIAATDSAVEGMAATTEAKAEPKEINPYEVSARKMLAGEPVAETMLYGREAVELIRLGIVDENLMQTYRSAAFLSRKNVYGEAAALAWEAEAKARHENAKAAFYQRRDGQVGSYDTSGFFDGENAA